MIDLKIFVFQHFDCKLPNCFDNRLIYKTIQGGRVLHDFIPTDYGDDLGDNISALNNQFCEMTSIYWIIKHFVEIGSPEFIGFDHYRRFLKWKPEELKRDVIIARKWFSWRPLLNQYGCCHSPRDLQVFLNRLMPQLTEVERLLLNKYSRSHGFYICNMFIMHRELFLQYAVFILKCITLLRELLKKGVLDLTQYSPIEKRVPGFILEWMTSYWIFSQKYIQGVTIKNNHIDHYDIVNGENGGNHKFTGFLWWLRQAY